MAKLKDVRICSMLSRDLNTLTEPKSEFEHLLQGSSMLQVQARPWVLVDISCIIVLVLGCLMAWVGKPQHPSLG